MRIYNPEGSLLRTDQKELVKMLKVFAKICEENDIRWWLCSGTLLGAARHKGFVPWDDDVDVSMLKQDYRKLEKVLAKMDSKEFFFQSRKTDIEYVNVFGRFCRKDGMRDSPSPRYQYFKYKGIGFDIFSIEKSNRFAAHMAKFFYANLQHPTQYIRHTGLRRFCVRLVEALCFGLLIPFSRLVGLVNPKKQYHYELGSGFYGSPFYEKDIFPLTEMEFEGEMFPVPGNTDAYLTELYGDWRQFPTEDQIRKSIHYKDYIREIFGE